MMQVQGEQLIFGAIPVVYSVGFFGWCYLAEKMLIFSKRNSRSTLTIVCGHMTTLLILIMLAQLAFQLYPSLPTWLTDELFRSKGAPYSIFGIVCALLVFAIGLAEKHWIYVAREPEDSSARDRSS